MDSRDRREDVVVYSDQVKAGKRTYFFDLKVTDSGVKYVSITESRKRVDHNTNEVSFQRHKILLYEEDFEKFEFAFGNMLAFLKSNG